MTFVSASQFHVYLPWGQRAFSIVFMAFSVIVKTDESFAALMINEVAQWRWWPLDVTECAEFVSVCHSRDDLVRGEDGW